VNHVYSSLSLKNKIINIACPREYTALELLQVIERFTDLSAKYKFVDAGIGYSLDTSFFANEASILQIELFDNYLLNAIQKHYAPKLSN
jgi:hypothetical protein